MCGVRALPSPRPYQPRLGKPINHHREQLISPVALGKTVPELAEYRVIEPGLRQLHPQPVLPIDPARHGPSRLPIGQVLRVLQHRHQRQPGRRHPTAAIHRKPADEVVIDKQILQPVPHHHRRRAFRARRPRHPRRLHRNSQTRTTTHRHPTIPAPRRSPPRQRRAHNDQANKITNSIRKMGARSSFHASSTPFQDLANGGVRICERLRRRLLVETADGLEPARFWLGGDGRPLAVSTWKSVLADTNERCRAFGRQGGGPQSQHRDAVSSCSDAPDRSTTLYSKITNTIRKVRPSPRIPVQRTLR
jgi:hypothetical protein